jgi:hypothetical protein
MGCDDPSERIDPHSDESHDVVISQVPDRELLPKGPLGNAPVNCSGETVTNIIDNPFDFESTCANFLSHVAVAFALTAGA